MTPEKQELNDKRLRLAGDIKDLQKRTSEEGYEWSAQDEERWSALNSEYDQTRAEIEKLDRADRVSKVEGELDQIDERIHFDRLRSTHGPSMTASKAFDVSLRAWFNQTDPADFTEEEHVATRMSGINVRAKEFTIPLSRGDQIRRVLQRADAPTLTTTVAEVIPEDWRNRLEMAMETFGGLRQVAEVIRTGDGNDLHLPMSNDTTNVAAILAEGAALESVALADTELVLGSYKYASMIQISSELAADNTVNLMSMVGGIVGERVGRGTAAHFATGTGSGQPLGLATIATVAEGADLGAGEAGTTMAVTDIIDLIHSVDPAYRRMARFVMHDTTLAVIRKFDNTTSNLLWQPSAQLGEPDRLFGYPITICNDFLPIADVDTDNEVAMTFGDHTAYKIRDAGGVRMRRLDERYAEKDLIGFAAFSRHDGAYANAGTDPIKAMVVGV